MKLREDFAYSTVSCLRLNSLHISGWVRSTNIGGLQQEGGSCGGVRVRVRIITKPSIRKKKPSMTKGLIKGISMRNRGYSLVSYEGKAIVNPSLIGNLKYMMRSKQLSMFNGKATGLVKCEEHTVVNGYGYKDGSE